MKYYYIKHDDDKNILFKLGTFSVDYSKLKEYNELGFGIFQATNETFGPIRKKENIKILNTFFCDIDKDTKEESIKKMKLVIEPTRVVETKRGYQLFYEIEEDIFSLYDTRIEAYNFFKETLETRILPYFNGDSKAKDITRLLRVPGFYHCKDPLNPFLVTEYSNSEKIYKLKNILDQFPIQLTVEERRKRLQDTLGTSIVNESKEKYNQNIFTKFNDISSLEVLLKLSGHPIVMGEKYTLVPNSSGHQIHVNGKSTGHWVDKNGKIGGGSFVNTHWIKWYLDQNKVDNPWKEIYKVIKELYPEL